MKIKILRVFIIGYCAFALTACGKIGEEKGIANQEIIVNDTVSVPYPNDEYIVINEGNTIKVLNDNFDIMLEFTNLPQIERDMLSSIYHPYIASGFYNTSQPLLLGKDDKDETGNRKGKYALYSVLSNQWIAEGFDDLYWGLEGYYGFKEGRYYQFNYQGDIIKNGKEEMKSPSAGGRLKSDYDNSVYDGGYYVWDEYYVLYKRGELGEIYSLFYEDKLIIEDVTLMSYQYGETFFVCSYLNSISNENWESVIFGAGGEEIYRSERDCMIVSVNKDATYVMETNMVENKGTNAILIKDMNQNIVFIYAASLDFEVDKIDLKGLKQSKYTTLLRD